MHRRRFTASILVAFALGGASSVLAQKPPATMENLVKVPSKQLRAVYLLPGADFRGYRKVILDPTHVAFAKNWQREFNSTRRGSSGRVTDADMQRIVDQAIQESGDIFTRAFTDGGYQVVTTPGPDVLRVSTGLVNIRITSPDINRSGRSASYSGSAGQATLIVEARDSQTGAVLGRAFDARLAGDTAIMMRRTTVSNRNDFRNLVRDWARISVRGLTELKTMSPIRG